MHQCIKVILFWNDTLHVSDGLSVHHKEFKTVPTARMKCMYFSNTTLFDGRDIYRIYYVKINYMFRPLAMTIFRLRLKNLVSSYTRLMWAVCSGVVRGEVGTEISHVLCRMGRCGYVGTWGSVIICYI